MGLKGKVLNILNILGLINHKTLKSLIKKEDDRSWVKIRIAMKQLYLPSVPSFIVLTVISFIFLTLSHLPFNFLVPNLYFRESNHYQNLIAILAGLSALIFSLSIFLATQFGEDHVKGEVLLKKSLLYPTVIITIFTFMTFLWFNVTVLSILPIILIGILTIQATYFMFQLLLSNYKLSIEKRNLIRNKFKKSVELAIDERIGNNKLLNELKSLNLKYEEYELSPKDNFYKFYSCKEGVIQDIDLEKLKKLSIYVKSKAREKDRSFGILTKPKEKIPIASFSPSYIKGPILILNKKYKDKVSKDDVLIFVNKDFMNVESAEKIKDNVNDIFTIKKDDNFSEEIRLELGDVKDQFLDAIKNENLSKIREPSKIYPELEETFIHSLKEVGGPYNFKQAQTERNNIFGGWTESEWLLDDIREIFNMGMKSDNISIIQEIGFLPILMAYKALNLDDHYFFQSFIHFDIDLYSNSFKKEDPELKLFMVNQSWRYLKEMSSLIRSKLSRGQACEELFSLKDFAIYLLIVFQYLLEKSRNKNDFESFEKFSNVSKNLFTHFKPSQNYPSSHDLKMQLENSQLELKESRRIRERLKLQTALEDIEKEINERKNQMFFGVATWIFSKNRKKFKKFYSEIEKCLPNDFRKFTEVFLSCHTLEADNFWGWIRWETLPEDHTITIDTMGKLEKFYVAQSLKLLKNMRNHEINLKFDNEEYNKDLYFLALDRFPKILDEIKRNPQDWEFILNQDEIEMINVFKELLEKSKKIWEEIEEEKIRKKELDDSKIETFKEEVFKEYEKWNSLRRIFIHYNSYVDKTDEVKEGITRFGLSRVDDKAAFFKDWHIEYAMWGSDYGQGMALGENLDLLKKILRHCQEINKNDFNNKLKSFKNISDVIILAVGYKSINFFTNFEGFKPSYAIVNIPTALTDLKCFEGYYQFKNRNIPIFNITGPSNEFDRVIILEKNNLGNLIQYSPLNKGENKELWEDIFYINIESFSENKKLLKEFLENPMEWLKEKGDKNKQKEYLMKKVRVQILERFKYETKNEQIPKSYFIKNFE